MSFGLKDNMFSYNYHFNAKLRSSPEALKYLGVSTRLCHKSSTDISSLNLLYLSLLRSRLEYVTIISG